MSGKPNGQRPGFSWDAWVSQTTKRINAIEGMLRNGQVPKNGKTGMSDLDPREADVLKRAFVQLEGEFDSIRLQHQQVLAERRDLLTMISGLEGSNRALEQGYNSVYARLSELAMQVQSYTETIQGIAIRPERAVPSVSTNPETGAPEINPVKVHTKTFWLASTPTSIAVPANGSAKVSFIVPPEQNQEGDMEIFFLEAASYTSACFRVTLNHTGINKNLMNQPCHGLAVFGSMLGGPQPFSMYESIFLQPNTALEVEIFDFSGSANTVELVVHGRKFIGFGTSGMDRRALVSAFARNTWPVWLTSDSTVALSTSTTSPTQFQLTQERQFHAEYGKVMQFGTVSGVPAPVFYHLQINEGASGALIANNVPIQTIAGNGNFPFPLPEPYLALRGTILIAKATNDSGISGIGTDLVLHGRGLPLSYPGQRTLEPAFDGRNVQLPPSHKDLSIPMMVSI